MSSVSLCAEGGRRKDGEVPNVLGALLYMCRAPAVDLAVGRPIALASSMSTLIITAYMQYSPDTRVKEFSIYENKSWVRATA